jgi:hypothetical protein
VEHRCRIPRATKEKAVGILWAGFWVSFRQGSTWNLLPLNHLRDVPRGTSLTQYPVILEIHNSAHKVTVAAE